MITFNLLKNAFHLIGTAIEALQLPLLRLDFQENFAIPEITEMFFHFTKRHPRYKLIRNKSVGMALVDLRKYSDRGDYLYSVSRKDQGGYHGKRAIRRGFVFREIDQNSYINDIHAINISVTERQGRPMDSAYLEKPEFYEKKPHFRYFGILDKQGILVAYCNIATYGNFCATDRLLGHKNNDGIMYLLLVEIICKLIEDNQVQYFMYDTFLGAQEGLRNFKRRLGFQPYIVRYFLNS